MELHPGLSVLHNRPDRRLGDFETGRYAMTAFRILIAFVCAAGLVACGGDDEQSGGSGPTKLKVGVIPIADVAPLYIGIENGFFKEENLEIEPALAEGGAAIVPAVVSGDNQIGFSNTTSLLIASSKGLPVQIVSQGIFGGTGDDDAPDALLVKKGSAIKEPKDLEGKTISVNTLNNVGPLTINNALEKRGVDYESVKYLEVPFPDAVAALEADRVDAIWVVEPFQTAATNAGHKILLHPFEEAAPSFTVATYFTSKEFLGKNKAAVDRFKRAMDKSLEYAQQHPDEVRKVVTTYTKIPAALAEKMVLPGWGVDLHEDTIELTSRLALKYGFVEKEPDLDELIYRGG
jgi:NitT/TauT family transport system substrate-binding protein